MAKKCEFEKKEGGRCGADAQPGKDSCVFHDPTKAAQVQEIAASVRFYFAFCRVAKDTIVYYRKDGKPSH